ncbi:MAG: chorismate synthase [Lachnospiraceae bacterium]|nr:chorismate synthase [Lachnospiraceae bacterium]
MNFSYGRASRFTIFGASHAAEIGVTIEGLPAGTVIDRERLQAFLERRAPGRDELSTSRREPDLVEFTAGVSACDEEGAEAKTVCADGGPLRAVIRNMDVRSGDYEAFRHTPRPGHADFAAMMQSGTTELPPGGGVFSGRMTAPLCIAGGIALQLLEPQNISVRAWPVMIGGETEEEQMRLAVARARDEGDSVGGIIQCEASGVPAGIGEPMFGGIENRIAGIVFGIPAVKGIEFGAGFAAASMRGSDHNDPFFVEEGRVKTRSNHAGGILGGITTGMPLVFRAAVKPTPSIAKEQDSVDMRSLTETKIRVGGRHDPCIVFRAVPVMEAAMACALLDAMMLRESA